MLEHFDTVLSFSVVMLLLSLLVTTIVQMILAVMGLRGTILQWGLERLLIQISPELEPDALAIAKAVLTHPMIVGRNSRPATAIRKEEFICLLDDLATKPSPTLSDEIRAKLKELVATARNQELHAAAQNLKEALETALPHSTAQIQLALDKTLAPVSKAVADTGFWFDTVMDRTTERFLLQTRWVTVIVAVVLALWLHIDSLSILRQLAASPEVRAKLIQSADATLKTADKTFALSADRQTIASAALLDVRRQFATNSFANLLKDLPTDLVLRNDGAAWLTTTFSNSTSLDTVLAAYETHFEQRSTNWLSALKQSTDHLTSTLTNSTLTIIPSPTPSLCDYCKKEGHLLGTLMTVLFLSLGAPFWYNVLRQLSNLRPAVAQKIEPKSVVGN